MSFDYLFAQGPKNRDLSVGLSFVQDEIGPSSFTQASGRISLGIKLANQGSFSWSLRAGIKGGMARYALNMGEVYFNNPTSTLGLAEGIGNLYPDLGAGILLLGKSSKESAVYFGFSMPQIFAVDRSLVADEPTEVKVQQQFYGTLGAQWPISLASYQGKLEALGLYRFSPNQYDRFDGTIRASLNLVKQSHLWLGTGYSVFKQWEHTQQIMHSEIGLGWAIGDQDIAKLVRFGYGLDIFLTSYTVDYGNRHELFLTFSF